MRKDLEAQIYIKDRLDKSENPAVLCSFGKDSMVVLWIVRQVTKNLPVVFFKEPFFPKKYRFANEIIDVLDLTVYDFPPVFTGHVQNGDNFEVVNWYAGYKGAYLYLPTGTHRPTGGEKFLCAKKDLIGKPRVTGYNFPWDTIFVGHKDGDIDPILGTTSLKARTVKIKGMTLALPLKNWTDKDIWDYTREKGIPFNIDRYDEDNDYREKPDKTYNNDYHPCCFKCLDNTEPRMVICPKTDKLVENTAKGPAENREKIDQVLQAANYVGTEKSTEALCPAR